MGYELGLYAAPKFGTFEEMKNTFNYFEWKNNHWNFELNENSGKAPYPTFKEYWTAFCDGEFPGEPSEECKFFYSRIGEPILIDYWCSYGREYLDDYIITHFDETSKGSECYLFELDYLYSIMQWADGEYDSSELKSVVPTKSVKIVDDESELMTVINGVVVEDNDGESYTCYKDYDDDLLFYCKNKDKYYCFDKLISALKTVEVLKKTGDYYVWFERSY